MLPPYGTIWYNGAGYFSKTPLCLLWNLNLSVCCQREQVCSDTGAGYKAFLGSSLMTASNPCVLAAVSKVTSKECLFNFSFWMWHQCCQNLPFHIQKYPKSIQKVMKKITKQASVKTCLHKMLSLKILCVLWFASLIITPI